MTNIASKQFSKYQTVTNFVTVFLFNELKNFLKIQISLYLLKWQPKHFSTP